MQDNIEVSGEIPSIVNAQKRFFENGVTMEPKVRIKLLTKLKNLIKKHESQIEDALYKDLGKFKEEAYLTEIITTYNDLNFAIDNLAAWVKPKKVKTAIFNQPGTSKIYYEPYGCICIISPWNYPFFLAISPAISAIAAGNRVVIKPSEIASFTSEFLEKFINQHFDEEQIVVIPGGKEVTEQIIDSRPDKIFFTGSTHIGSIIMQRAAKHLIPVTLELGGKSPCIVDKDTNITIAARRIVWGKFLNAGQTCIAPDMVYVHAEIFDKLQYSIVEAIKDMYPQESQNKNLGRIINQTQFDRIKDLIAGEDIVYGGNTNREDLFIEPTVVINPDERSKIQEVEIFGPILPLIKYKDYNKLLQTLRRRPKPLTLYIFSNIKSIAIDIAKKLPAGNVCINDTMVQFGSNHLPFGGVGQSGIGNYRGKFGFKCFSHEKAVLHKKISPDIRLRYLPHIIGFKKLERWLLLLSKY